jgi:hypothetical protein
MAQNKYSNIGKKQIISVLNETIRKLQIVEFTLNAYIEFAGEDIAKEFDEFMIKKLGGKNETQTNAPDNNGGDSAKDNGNS